MYDIITMGSNTVDMFVHTDQSDVIHIHSNASSSDFISYPVGAKMLITKLKYNLGGNGVNAAVALSRLSMKTAYLGEVGRDQNGKTVMDCLRKEKIDFIGTRGAESGFSIVLDSIEEDRTILTYKGCSNDLAYKDLKISKLKTKWFYLSSMLGQSLATMQKIAAYARKNNIRIAFNPSATILEKEPKTASELLRYTDLLVLNKEEAETLVGKASVEENLKKLLLYGMKTLVITDGKRGAAAYHEGHFYNILPRQDLKVVETTGAGDAFASTLTAGLALNKPFEFCLKMAINNAESVISHYGAQNLLLSRKKLFEIVNKDKRPILKKKA